MLSRAEHLQWAKDRALEYLQPAAEPEVRSYRNHGRGRIYDSEPGHGPGPMQDKVTPKQLSDACASFLSDLAKHPEIDPMAASLVFGIEVMSGGLNTAQKVRDFINGTN